MLTGAKVSAGASGGRKFKSVNIRLKRLNVNSPQSVNLEDSRLLFPNLNLDLNYAAKQTFTAFLPPAGGGAVFSRTKMRVSG